MTSMSDKLVRENEGSDSMAPSCTCTPPKHRGHRRRRYLLGLESGGNGVVWVCCDGSTELLSRDGDDSGEEDGSDEGGDEEAITK